MSSPPHVIALLRDMTGQSVLLSEAVARRAGLSPADLEVLGTIDQRGPLTAGQLGAATGLSPAAVTGLIDRLERAGVARRRPDASDRRRVLVEVAEGSSAIAALFASLERDMLRLLERRSPAQLKAIAEFLHDARELGVEHVARLQATPKAGKR